MATIEVILDGETRSITKEELFALASQGRITPQTNLLLLGKLITADRVKGITFLGDEEEIELVDLPNTSAYTTPVMPHGNTVFSDSQYKQAPFPSPMGYPQPTKHKSGAAVTSFMLGFIGLIAWILPIVGFPIAISGFICGCVGVSGSNRGTAISGIILNVIGLVLATINSAIGAYQGATGQLF